MSEVRHPAIVDTAADAIVTIDESGRVESVNPAVLRMFGYEPADLVGRNVSVLMPPEVAAEHSTYVRRYLDSGEPHIIGIGRVVEGLRKDGSRFPLDLAVSEVRLAGRRLFTGIMRDVSARRRADDSADDRAVAEEYRRARQVAEGAKLRSLGQLAGGVAHDLNQYLGLVVGYGDLAMAALSREPIDVDAVRDSITTMIRAAEDGAEGVRRLLLFARPGVDGPPGRVDLDELLREVAKLTAPRWRDAAQQEGRPISVELEVEGEVAVDGWASDLREAFANLVLNAVDALPRGGSIRLAVRQREGQVVAEVADDGIGMLAETRARLFEPFFSTKGEGGSGLGLAIVFGIVERHGGTIAVESAPGIGTCFRLAFPAAARAEGAGPSAPDPDVARQLRILVVDDEPTLVEMLARLLSSDGHDLAIATSGEEVLAILAGRSVDVVISDLGMGAGMNGWDLAAAVRALPVPPRFILTTGWGAEIDPEDAAARGVLAVVSKPYRLPDLRKILNTL